MSWTPDTNSKSQVYGQRKWYQPGFQERAACTKFALKSRVDRLRVKPLQPILMVKLGCNWQNREQMPWRNTLLWWPPEWPDNNGFNTVTAHQKQRELPYSNKRKQQHTNMHSELTRNWEKKTHCKAWRTKASASPRCRMGAKLWASRLPVFSLRRLTPSLLVAPVTPGINNANLSEEGVINSGF